MMCPNTVVHRTGPVSLALLLAFGLVVLASAPAPAATGTGSIDRVEVYKAKHELRLVSGDQIIRKYRVALGRHEGKKERAGDNRTPEGVYVIDYVKSDSQFHRALHISYPNSADSQQAHQRGVSPGGDIMIHGLPGETPLIKRIHALFDWTKGCIALTNPEIDEVAHLVKPGTPITIYP